MSYTANATSGHTTQFRMPETPMIYDIAAIQFLYGANFNFNPTSDSYGFTGHEKAITWWDGGGTDWFDGSDQTIAVKIDLREGFDASGNQYVTTIGPERIFLAYHAHIENAKGGSANDTIYGSNAEAAVGQYSAFDGRNTLYGNGGNDIIYGDHPTDTVGNGDDIIYGGSGLDTIYGNGGQDSINGGNGTGDSTDGGDLIYGNAGYDTIKGNGGDDIIYGGNGGGDSTDGADSISSGEGNDSAYGNGGDDTIIGGTGNDTVNAGANNDIVFGDASVYGASDGADSLLGAAGDDYVYGGGGADTIDGGAGFDWVVGDSDGNTYTTSTLGAGDILYGGSEDDVVVGGAGNDLLYGDGISEGAADGSDLVVGNMGDDTIYGGGNRMDGQYVLYDTLEGREGNDEIHGGSESAFLLGGVGNDKLYGAGLYDDLWGEEGDDSLYGSDSNYSYLQGGTGNDKYYLITSGAGEIQDSDNSGNIYFNGALVAGTPIQGSVGWGIYGGYAGAFKIVETSYGLALAHYITASVWDTFYYAVGMNYNSTWLGIYAVDDPNGGNLMAGSGEDMLGMDDGVSGGGNFLENEFPVPLPGIHWMPDFTPPPLPDINWD